MYSAMHSGFALKCYHFLFFPWNVSLTSHGLSMATWWWTSRQRISGQTLTFFSFKDGVSILLQCGFNYYFFITLMNNNGNINNEPANQSSNYLQFSMRSLVPYQCVHEILQNLLRNILHGLSMSALWWTRPFYFMDGTAKAHSLRPQFLWGR